MNCPHCNKEIGLLYSWFIIPALIVTLFLSGCTAESPLTDCRQSTNGYEVYVGDSVYYNCSLYGGGFASPSGCTFNACDGFNSGEYIHTNEYIKRCP